MGRRYAFVTGKLAAPLLHEILPPLAARVGFEYSIETLGISVAALMTPHWVAAHLRLPAGTNRIMVPGSCSGDWSTLATALGCEVEIGPADARDLPDHFGQPEQKDYGRYSLEIIAEINHAPRLTPAAILGMAHRFRAQGADVIDLGCIPGEPWSEIAACVRALRAEGLRVSVDSFDPQEVAAAVRAGAELVLSVNSTNCHEAPAWDCEVVAIPDSPNDLDSLARTSDFLSQRKIKHRLDPILEPIGMGCAASLGRYIQVRQRFPDHEIMMGTGNLTELTEVDSVGINVLLAGMCEELGIRSVLTTAVANWAQSSVAELNLARRLVRHAVRHRMVPKKLEPNLLLLRDRKLKPRGPEELQRLAASIRDPNYRIFAEQEQIHVMNGQMHLRGDDPYAIFSELVQRAPVSADHAFYLGYELAKATIALALGKAYVQDQPLNWGFLTRPETSHHRRGELGGGSA